MSHAAPESRVRSGAAFTVGIVAARYNEELVDALLDRAQKVLLEAGVRKDHITVWRVPGSHEVPWAAQQLARRRGCDGVLALGVLIGGETHHHEIVGRNVSQALLQVSLDARVPVINGVIVADTHSQAEARCRGRIDRGAEFARALLEMAALRRKARR